MEPNLKLENLLLPLNRSTEDSFIQGYFWPKVKYSQIPARWSLNLRLKQSTQLYTGLLLTGICECIYLGSRLTLHKWVLSASIKLLQWFWNWTFLSSKSLSKGMEISHKAGMVYKSLNYVAPDYLSSKFILHSDIFNSYKLRDSENKLAVPLPWTNNTIEIASATVRGAVLWNN